MDLTIQSPLVHTLFPLVAVVLVVLATAWVRLVKTVPLALKLLLVAVVVLSKTTMEFLVVLAAATALTVLDITTQQEQVSLDRDTLAVLVHQPKTDPVAAAVAQAVLDKMVILEVLLPQQAVLDASGDLLVSIGGSFGGVARIDSDTGRLETVSQGGQILSPAGLTLDANGQVVRQEEDRSFDGKPDRISTFSGGTLRSVKEDSKLRGCFDLEQKFDAQEGVANDIRLLACGPRAGLAELKLPENEPGSSIMPGKVNPTQCEAMAMVCTQVMGLDAAVAIAGSGGHLQMNVYKPLIGFNLLQAITLLTDACRCFRVAMVEGMEPNPGRIQELVERSLMLVTALTPAIGYEKATTIAKHAHANGSSLREAALELGFVSADDFDRIVDPAAMAIQQG